MSDRVARSLHIAIACALVSLIATTTALVFHRLDRAELQAKVARLQALCDHTRRTLKVTAAIVANGREPELADAIVMDVGDLEVIRACTTAATTVLEECQARRDHACVARELDAIANQFIQGEP